LRRLVSLTFVCTFVFFAGLAHAQQLDFALGGNTLWSPRNPSASGGFIQPPERGGTYPSVFLQYIGEQNHLGLEAEGAFRYHEGSYNGFQPYRPFLYDVNAVYTNRVAAKTHADVMAGLGGQTLLFYSSTNECGLAAGGCHLTLTSNHFLFHAGIGIRYYFLHNLFVRPEAHYYIILDNHEFHSDNVFRVGASIGYTWGTH
jgi:hypothetical protein